MTGRWHRHWSTPRRQPSRAAVSSTAGPKTRSAGASWSSVPSTAATRWARTSRLGRPSSRRQRWSTPVPWACRRGSSPVPTTSATTTCETSSPRPRSRPSSGSSRISLVLGTRPSLTTRSGSCTRRSSAMRSETSWSTRRSDSWGSRGPCSPTPGPWIPSSVSLSWLTWLLGAPPSPPRASLRKPLRGPRPTSSRSLKGLVTWLTKTQASSPRCSACGRRSLRSLTCHHRHQCRRPPGLRLRHHPLQEARPPPGMRSLRNTLTCPLGCPSSGENGRLWSRSRTRAK
mmetsp:Transcript_21082/g.61521  ORF Transcript_21082/g.61521 Transcript_21082/m.61521 type:complete len:286 (+) Transcript_21082:885-1742(+)